jgi:hypothetical protein
MWSRSKRRVSLFSAAMIREIYHLQVLVNEIAVSLVPVCEKYDTILISRPNKFRQK